MALFDFLGVGKSVKPDDAAGGEPEVSVRPPRTPVPPRKFWLRLAAADLVVVLACMGLVVSRVMHHSALPPNPSKPAAKPAPKSDPVAAESPKPEAQKADSAGSEQAKASAQKPEAAKPEAKKPDAEKPSEPVKPVSSTAKGPLGSPSVHAKALPERAAALLEESSKAAAKPKPGAAASAKPEAKPVSKPANFDYINPDAKEVYLIGMFLVRTGGKRKMYKDSKGTWETTVYLNAGQTYKYQYEVLGKDGKRSLTPKKSLDVIE